MRNPHRFPRALGVDLYSEEKRAALPDSLCRLDIAIAITAAPNFHEALERAPDDPTHSQDSASSSEMEQAKQMQKRISICK